jgi:hypothetical protein
MVRSIVLRISTALAVALGAAAVLVASGSSARANTGDYLVLGQQNFADAATHLQNTYSDAFASFASSNDIAVYGSSGQSGGYGVCGTGVYGLGNTNGVFGESSNAGASGVYGQNDSTGFGVSGSGGTGVAGSGTSIGVSASSANGTALQVSGRARFSTAGIAVIASGKKSVTVTLAGVTTSDFILATV